MSDLVNRLRLQAEDLHSLNPASETVKCLSLGADEIERLRAENTALRARVTELEGAIDNEMVVTHLGVFGPGDAPKVALNKLMSYAEDLGAFFAQDELKNLRNRVAELEAENAKLRTIPLKYRRMEFNAQLQQEVQRLEAENAALRAVFDAARGKQP